MKETNEIIVRINPLERRQEFANELLSCGYTVRYEVKEVGVTLRGGTSTKQEYYVIATKQEQKCT